MRRCLVLLTLGLALIGEARIYNGKSRHERQAPDEFENQLQPVGESENFNPYEVVSVDGQSPVRYHHTECGIVLKEIAVLQPVNSDRDQFILKRILIEKDTGKPASGPCAEALQASIDKEDAGKAPYEPPERIDGGVEPRKENNVIAELPYMSAPIEPPRDHSFPLDNNVQRHPQRPYGDAQFADAQTHHGYRKGKKCANGRKETAVEENRSPRKCRRKDLPPQPVVIPWCNTEKPWLNTAPCQMPPTPEYKEVVRPRVEQVEMKPQPKRRQCVHRPRQSAPLPEIAIQPPSRPAKCRNRNVGLPPNGQPHHHNHLHHSNHNNELKTLDPVYERRDNSVNEPGIEMEDDRKKREDLQPIAALPVYRI
ncbi:unnamed protein product, partial [Mesorhabditis belari]|uniref:Uncharacterized protein n=1 Tax=Mesorhabditis belari TaxID=2138241 RepID=A0AAF3F692_9BILA